MADGSAAEVIPGQGKEQASFKERSMTSKTITSNVYDWVDERLGLSELAAIRDVSHDMTGQRKVRLANGREVSALDIQQEYLSKARDFIDRKGADPITARVLSLWERTLSAVETGDLGPVAREIDWVTKYQLIERYRAKHDLTLSSPRVAQLDLAYHDVHRGRGLYYLLQHRGAVERVCRDIDIFEAKSLPPQTRSS